MKTSEAPVRRARTGAGSRINADNIWLYRAIVLLVISSGTAGIIMSWDGLLYAADWLLLPEHLSWTFGVAMDVPIATLALAALAMKSRGRELAAVMFLLLGMFFATICGTANFMYVASVNQLANELAWAGAIGKGMAPFVTLVMTEVLGALVTRPTGEKSALNRARADLKAAKTELRDLRRRVRRTTTPAEVTE